MANYAELWQNMAISRLRIGRILVGNGRSGDQNLAVLGAKFGRFRSFFPILIWKTVRGLENRAKRGS